MRIHPRHRHTTHDTGRIQIDDPVLGCFCDEGFRRRMREAGVDPARLLDTYLGVLDACVRGRPAGMAAGVHICRGNVKVRVSISTCLPFPFSYPAGSRPLSLSLSSLS